MAQRNLHLPCQLLSTSPHHASPMLFHFSFVIVVRACASVYSSIHDFRFTPLTAFCFPWVWSPASKDRAALLAEASTSLHQTGLPHRPLPRRRSRPAPHPLGLSNSCVLSPRIFHALSLSLIVELPKFMRAFTDGREPAPHASA